MKKYAVAVLFSWMLIPLAFCGPAAAEGFLYEIKMGVLAHDVDNLWSNKSREEGTDYNGELVFTPTWHLWKGTVRPNLGFSINNSGDTSKVYGGGVWEYLFADNWFFDAGLGIAYHNGETDEERPDKKALGSELLFRVSFEVGYTMAEHHRLSLMFDHISNGYLADPNEGLDTLGLRYGFKF